MRQSQFAFTQSQTAKFVEINPIFVTEGLSELNTALYQSSINNSQARDVSRRGKRIDEDDDVNVFQLEIHRKHVFLTPTR